MYHGQSVDERPKLLAGFIKAAIITHGDPLTRDLLQRFHIKESNHYALQNSKHPPSVA